PSEVKYLRVIVLKRIVIPIALLAITAVVLIIARETRETVALVGAIHPLLGQGLLGFLLTLYALCLLVPIVTFIRLPKPLEPPAPDNVAVQAAYLEELAKRLRRNKNLTDREVTPATVERALGELGQLAQQRTTAGAIAVFLSTAVSQSGRLDGLMVLVTQCRLVWQIAHLYWQRPALGDLISLYGNVGAAAFVAQNVEDMDLSELIEPLLAPVLANSVVAAIPGFAQVASLVASSCVDGTVNAFLTLRIGCLASAYCGSRVKLAPRSLRRTATVQAAGMLGAVASQGAERVGLAMWDAAKSTGDSATSALVGAAKNTLEQVSNAAQRLTDASGARAATGFLVQIVADGATKTSTAIAEIVARGKSWRG
ncbi:MAG TPA: DUF697 domain-containing protein, partial [Roseiflexaceae bacterium]|nr:DUF697 domain-containing protein [Roseiflexaceae bacterium]